MDDVAEERMEGDRWEAAAATIFSVRAVDAGKRTRVSRVTGAGLMRDSDG